MSNVAATIEGSRRDKYKKPAKRVHTERLYKYCGKSGHNPYSFQANGKDANNDDFPKHNTFL